jgi:hypothetical protein
VIRSGLPPSVPTGSSHRSERNPQAPAFEFMEPVIRELKLTVVNRSKYKKTSREFQDLYYQLNPKGRSYETLKELSDSEVITLALFQQLRGVDSERSFLREVGRFFSHLFPGAVGLRRMLGCP